MRRALWTLLFGGVFLLMLSALVVAPPREAPPAPQWPPPQDAALCALPRDASIPAANHPVPQTESRRMEAVAAQATHPLPIPQNTDANGRVLRDGRYENCVYQVFRASVAGG